MKDTFGVDELPIGVLPNNQGLVTLTGGWVDEFPNGYDQNWTPVYQTAKLMVVLAIKTFTVVQPRASDAKKAYKVKLCF